MIEIFYEFSCETCSCGDHPPAKTKNRAIKSYRKLGGIVTQDGKTYCSSRCYKARTSNAKNH